MRLTIRKYHPSDIISLYNICLITSNKGKDVKEFKEEPDLLGHLFVGPYVTLEPELCFVLLNNYIPYGYILGTKDTEYFYHQCETKWFPPLRKRYTLPPEHAENSRLNLIKKILHQGHKPKDNFEQFPAHLHIDILPAAQGKGMGKKLMNEFIKELKNQNVPGLHLEVGKSNTNAIKFYKNFGFNVIKEYEYSLVMGIEIK